MTTGADHDAGHGNRGGHHAARGLALGALGIVYGDLGTSPLYALRETFGHNDIEVTKATAYGAASIAFWSLIIVVSIKYLVLVMRADNRGEGGILAFTALVVPRRKDGSAPRRDLRPTGIAAGVITLGVFGTALLYGDGLITPAISVLSAVEGFEVATSAFEDWVIPVSHGFIEAPAVVPALSRLAVPGGPFDIGTTTFFLGDEIVVASELEGMHPWREQLYEVLDRGAESASRFFELPADRVVTVGTHVEI